MCFKKIKEDSVQIPSQRNRIPSFRQNDLVMCPDAHQCLLFKLASFWTSQQHVWTLFRAQEESCIQVHPSGRCGNTVRMLVSVRQVKWFPSQTQIWEDSYNRSDAILDKARRGEELQPSGCQGNTIPVLVLIMEVQPSGHKPNMVLCEVCYGKPVAQLFVRTPPRENQIRVDLGLLNPIYSGL